MLNSRVATGVVHGVPSDMREILLSTEPVRVAWNDLTPLARNEWICWVTSAKRDATRHKRIDQVRSDLLDGKRRPCCWPGCSHRDKW